MGCPGWQLARPQPLAVPERIHGFIPADGVREDETYEHVFETTGSDERFWILHESTGIVGTVQVT